MAEKKAAKWFEVVAHAQGEGLRVVELPDGQRFSVRGPIHDIMVVMMENEEMQAMVAAGVMQKVLEALNVAMRGAGFEGGMVVAPSNVKFMQLQPVEWSKARLLEQRDRWEAADRKARQTQMEAAQDAKREAGAVDLGAVQVEGEA